jgi:hypothetical protein
LNAGRSKEEEYEEWLGRLDIPIESQDTIDHLRDYLKDELGITGDSQVEALWGAVQHETDFGEHGIKQVRVEYPWGVEVRYGIQGMSGLWGWATVQEIREGEEW